MLLKFATKRDINGNCNYIAVDHARKEYATAPHGIIYRTDVIEVKAADLKKIRAAAEAAQYKRIETL